MSVFGVIGSEVECGRWRLVDAALMKWLACTGTVEHPWQQTTFVRYLGMQCLTGYWHAHADQAYAFPNERGQLK